MGPGGGLLSQRCRPIRGNGAGNFGLRVFRSGAIRQSAFAHQQENAEPEILAQLQGQGVCQNSRPILQEGPYRSEVGGGAPAPEGSSGQIHKDRFRVPVPPLSQTQEARPYQPTPEGAGRRHPGPGNERSGAGQGVYLVKQELLYRRVGRQAEHAAFGGGRGFHLWRLFQEPKKEFPRPPRDQKTVSPEMRASKGDRQGPGCGGTDQRGPPADPLRYPRREYPDEYDLLSALVEAPPETQAGRQAPDQKMAQPEEQYRPSQPCETLSPRGPGGA